jgi:hypothetical protein
LHACTKTLRGLDEAPVGDLGSVLFASGILAESNVARLYVFLVLFPAILPAIYAFVIRRPIASGLIGVIASGTYSRVA